MIYSYNRHICAKPASCPRHSIEPLTWYIGVQRTFRFLGGYTYVRNEVYFYDSDRILLGYSSLLNKIHFFLVVAIFLLTGIPQTNQCNCKLLDEVRWQSYQSLLWQSFKRCLCIRNDKSPLACFDMYVVLHARWLWINVNHFHCSSTFMCQEFKVWVRSSNTLKMPKLIA